LRTDTKGKISIMAKALTVMGIDALKAKGRYPAGGAPGLLVQVTLGKDGSPRRSFVLRYKIGGKSREAGLGAYPATSLAEARDKANEMRKQLKTGVDPLTEKARASSESNQTFEAATKAFLDYVCAKKADTKFPGRTARQWRNMIARHAGPKLGKMNVRDIRHEHVAAVLMPLALGKGTTKRQAKGGPTVATRLRSYIQRILDFAASNGFRDPDAPNPARPDLLKDILGTAPKAKHHATAPLAEVPAIYQRLALETDTVSNAIRFIMLTACRLREVLDAQFTEIDLAAQTFSVPPARSKTGEPHLVPLSSAAMEIIKAQAERRQSYYVFPGRFGGPLASSTIAPALKRAGVTNSTLHGFRSSFRSWAAENGTDDNVAELSLAHKIGNSVQQAYYRTTLLEKRRVCMEAYCDWLAGKEPASNVLEFPVTKEVG
jgi:integrase